MKKQVIDMRRYPDQLRFSPAQEKERAVTTPFPFSAIEEKEHEKIITRDPLGQMPLHYFIDEGRVYVANAIKDLMLLDGYDYNKVSSVRHASALHVPQEGAPYETRYADLHHHLPRDFDPNELGDIEYSAQYVRKKFDEVMQELLTDKTKPACLLSGGVDSMVAAYLTSRKLPEAECYSMGISSEAEDIALAREYAKAFQMKHNIVRVARTEITKSLVESIWRSEIYHQYNVYCAVGMVLLARHLSHEQISHAMSGEGANEAFGDYHNWDITLQDGSVRRIQSTDISTFNTSKGRHAYIWGNPGAEEKGFYNRQLGSGLAKHGTSRMYKPMNEHGIQLYSPFMQVDIMKVLASIPDKELQAVGGKPGFMAMVFEKDVASGNLPRDFFINRKKTRLQDANPDGQGGITEILLNAGYSQEKIIEIFNGLFRSDITMDDRFTNSILK